MKTVRIIYIFSMIFCIIPDCLAFQEKSTIDSTGMLRSEVSEVMKIVRQESFADQQNIEVVTASNLAEKLSKAPANTFVISKEDIANRAYLSMVDILKDLPQIDMAVSYGDAYFKAYMRGSRTNISSSYLIMIDGIIFNHLYFSNASILSAFPLSNIERIEVVFGPASAVYGPNAASGVINIITITENERRMQLDSKTSMSEAGLFRTDYSLRFKQNKLMLSLSGRAEIGNANMFINDQDFYWLRSEIQSSPQLWGNLAQQTSESNKFSSPIRQYATDFRLHYNNLEIGAQYFLSQSGYGTAYPGDRIPGRGLWSRGELSVYGRYKTKLRHNLFSKTLLRYRQSTLDRGSYDIEGYSLTNRAADSALVGGIWAAPGEKVRVNLVTYWESFNSSVSFYQDFDWQISDKVRISAGFKFEDRNLQKAYENYYGPEQAPDPSFSAISYFPDLQTAFQLPFNRIRWQDLGAYTLLKYSISPNHVLHLGGRVDRNSAYGLAPTMRLGYVAEFNRMVVKLFYGESFQEPAPRLLYAGWKGSGSDPDLKPEQSQTFELNLKYSAKNFTTDANLYYILATNNIVNFPGGAKNLGERQILGFDWHIYGTVKLFQKTEYRFTYTGILQASEQKFGTNGQEAGQGSIGDIAAHKLHLALSSKIGNHWFIAPTMRFIGPRKTVDSNPIRETEAFFVTDLGLTYRHFFVKGLHLGLRVENLFDSQYFHPGLRTADSGPAPLPVPTTFGGGNTWQESGGWYNSLLPQPRRSFNLSLIFQI